MKSHFLYSILFCLLTAGCQSASQLSITTLTPAEITFLPSERNLVIVNRATEEPAENDNSYIDLQGKKQAFRPEYEKLVPVFVQTLTEGLDQTNYFSSVRVWPADSLPEEMRDRNVPLSEDQLAEIRQTTGAQTVLCLNGYRYEATLRDHVLPGGAYFRSTLDMVAKAGFDLCRPGETPVSYSFPDTLFWEGYGFSPDEARLQLPPYADCLTEAAIYAAHQQIKHLTPYPTEENRYYFTSSNPAMRDAAQYVRQNRWQEASYLWEYVYEKSKSTSTRAKAAANLALYYELDDRYSQALEWAQQAVKLAKEKYGNGSSLTQWLIYYTDRLSARIKDDMQLRPQL